MRLSTPASPSRPRQKSRALSLALSALTLPLALAAGCGDDSIVEGTASTGNCETDCATTSPSIMTTTITTTSPSTTSAPTSTTSTTSTTDPLTTTSPPTTEPTWTSTGLETTSVGTSTTEGTTEGTSTTDDTGTDSDTDASTGTDSDSDTDTDTSTGTDSDTSTGGTDSEGTDTGTGTDSDTDTDTDTDTGGEELFPPPGEFGDEDFGVQELDLVGSWSLQWDENAPWNSELVIDDLGGFTWRETSDGCMKETLATGIVWVENSQLVLHVDTWERALPFDTEPYVNETFAPPFRLRLGYSLQGSYLALAGPEMLVEAEPYVGRSFTRQSVEGDYLAGEWRGEAELIAVPEGAKAATVIVRDRFIAYLDPEQGVDPEGLGEVLHDQVFWMADPPVPGPIVYEGGNWTCLDGCPQPAGATLINGANLHAYGPYAGLQHLMTFASGRAFKRDVPASCP